MMEQAVLGQNGTAHGIARTHMVDSQVRPNQVNDRRVIAAMRDLPREAFAPADALAYADADIKLPGGRTMLAPMLIARLTQLVMAENPLHVLVVGAGAGYGAAILAACGANVVALDDDVPPSAALARLAPTVEAVNGRLALGWPAAGPYDVIFIEGAVSAIPQIFAAQLTKTGRIVTILADGAGGIGRAVVAEPSGGGFALSARFDCAARIIPAFQPAAVFTF